MRSLRVAASSCGVVQQFHQRRFLAGGARQFHREARRGEGAVHVQQQQALAAAPAREDVVQRRRRLALRLEHGRDLLGVQPPGGAGAAVDHARDLVGHHRQVVQRLAVVFERADVHLGQPRAGAVGVDEQADVDAVAVLERQLLQQRAPGRDDAAQRLAEAGQFGEEDLEHGLGGELGDAAAAAAEARLHEVGLAALQRGAQVAHDAGAQAGEVAVEIGHEVALRRQQAVVHRRALAEHGAGDDARHRPRAPAPRCRRWNCRPPPPPRRWRGRPARRPPRWRCAWPRSAPESPP